MKTKLDIRGAVIDGIIGGIIGAVLTNVIYVLLLSFR